MPRQGGGYAPWVGHNRHPRSKYCFLGLCYPGESAVIREGGITNPLRVCLIASLGCQLCEPCLSYKTFCLRVAVMPHSPLQTHAILLK